MTDSGRWMMRALGPLGWISVVGLTGCDKPEPPSHRHDYHYTLSTAIAELPEASSLAIGPDGFYLSTPGGVLVAGPEGGMHPLALRPGPATRSIEQVSWGLDCLFLADRQRHRIWRLVGEESAEPLAGNGNTGPARDGLAIQVPVEHPRAVATAPDGHTWFIAGSEPKLGRLDRNGRLSWLPGEGLVDPVGLTPLGPDEVAIADRGRHQILSWKAGKLAPLAGTGESGFAGDGGPARSALLSSPSAVIPSPRGGLLIADPGNGRVRWIRKDGNIETIAGSGESGPTDEASDARTAKLSRPVSLAVAPDGTPAVLDSLEHRVYLLHPPSPASSETSPSGTNPPSSGETEP